MGSEAKRYPSRHRFWCILRGKNSFDSNYYMDFCILKFVKLLIKFPHQIVLGAFAPTVDRDRRPSPSAKWQNFVTMLFFGIKIPTNKHEIMLLAMSLNGGSRTSTKCIGVLWQFGTNWISALLIRQRQSGSGARVFVRVLKRKADRTLWTQTEPV